MFGERFWRGYDWVARADLALGWIFDWRKWLWGFVPSGGGMTLLWAAIEGRSPIDVWIAAVIVMAALAVLVYFLIAILERVKVSGKRREARSASAEADTARAMAAERLPSRNVKIVLGTGHLFESVQPSGINRARIISIKIENNTDQEISDGCLEILNLDPPNKGHEKISLKGDLKIGPRKHALVPIVSYNEGTSHARVGTWIRLAIPIAPVYGGGSGNLPVQPHTFHLRFSSSEVGVFDEVAFRLFVDSNHILHLEDWADSSKPRITTPLKWRPDIDAKKAFFQILEKSEWTEGQTATTINTNQLVYDWLERRLSTEIHRALRNSELDAWGEEVLSRTADTPEKPIPADVWDRVEIHFDRTDAPRTSALWRIDRPGMRTAWAGIKFSSAQIFQLFPLKGSSQP